MRSFDWLRAVRDEPAITGTRMLVLLTVGSYIDGQGFLSVKQLTKTGLGERAVRGHLTWAHRSGWLLRTRRGHRLGNGQTVASEYVLTVPSTGTGVSVEQPSSGTPAPVDPVSSGTEAPVDNRSQPASGAPQPASDDAQPAPRCRPYASNPEPLPPEPLPRRDSQASPDPDVSDEARDLCRFFVTEHCRPNSHGVPSQGAKAHRTWLVEMDRLLRIGPPNVGQGIDAERVRGVITFMAAHRGNGSFPGWSAVIESVPKFRKQFVKVAAAMEAERRNGDRSGSHLDRNRPELWLDDGSGVGRAVM